MLKLVLIGLASWYNLPGNLTANGEMFDPTALTAAHKTLPFNTLVEVTHKKRSVVVRINDRGPFVDGRIIDLTPAAADQLDMRATGVGEVSLKIHD